MDSPDVSVVIPVYNTMPYLTKCLDSLVAQSIGLGRLEIVAVDDGSTDGSGEELDRLQRRHPDAVKVIHQPNSGGPAAPCNRGLEVATGRFVYFLGADDYLGREALERLVSAADRYGSDVVLGKLVGVNGRYVNKEIFSRTVEDITLHDSPLAWSLANTKLFRRSLIDQYGLRYREDLRFASDQPFTLEAFVRAKRISVMADYDYYFAVKRKDDSNITFRTDHLERLRCVEAIMDFAAELIPAGPKRDAVHHRHFHSDLAKLLRADLLERDERTRQVVFEGAGRIARRYLTDPISARLEVSRRVRMTLAARGHVDKLREAIADSARPEKVPLVFESGRLYSAQAGFRDPTLGLDDEVFAAGSYAANLIGNQLRVCDVRWGRSRQWGPTLEFTLRHDTLDLTGEAQIAVAVNGAAITPAVALGRDAQGSVATVSLPVRQVLSAACAKKQAVAFEVTALGSTAVVRPGVSQLPARRYGVLLHRWRVFGLGMRVNKAGKLAVAGKRLTLRWMLGRLRRTVMP